MNSGSAKLSFLPEDSNPVQSHVARLRLRAQTELDPLHILDFSDRFLIKFLRARDFDVDLSLKLLVNYERWRSERTTAAAESWSTEYVIAMETETQQQGVKVIFDLEGWSFSHALQINPALARKISSVLADSFPLKVKGIHLINEPIFFRPFFRMLRPFLPDKIKQRVHMHGSSYHDSLTDFFPSSLLPPEYGGEGPGLEEACQQWTNRLLQSERLLEQIAAHRTGDVAVGNQITEEQEEEPVSL
ncbi:hypothetical protein NHX12_004499 [Muraenolepis orangiensis]|uniref:CRAL-TRIO domain-containing protein n=1 Tax=Muraenolepis orangiensis TaxID=630683 RepID=A0A9Q0IEB6_9TELE|nr:hypothetical protein NHX12_004499 [Muraenolepis orangiensis]